MAIVRCPVCDEIGIFPDMGDGELPKPAGCLYDEAVREAGGCDAPAWYAVHTRPQRETEAAAQLKRQGYRTFYPFRRVRRYKPRPGRPNGERVEVEKPQFTRYLFVAILEGQGLYGVNEADAVSTVVYGERGPLRIPGQVITRLMAVCDSDGLVAAEDLTAPRFDGRVGEDVRFREDHPMAGLVAEIASVAGLDRTGEITVWLRLLGARRKVPVPVNAVLPMGARS